MSNQRTRELEPPPAPAPSRPGVTPRPWAIPAALLIPLIALTILGIHGSSIGVYRMALFGNAYDDPDLLLGNPQPIRSDEWLVATPYAISQVNNDFLPTNPDLGLGQDMTVLSDAPYAEWSTIFRPQNLAFLAMPAENAFAFKWWFMGWLFVVALYFLILELLPGRRWLAIALAMAAFLSPLVQWWYISGTFNALSLPILAVIATMRIVRAKRTLPRLAWTALLVYSLASFLMIFYPPFQIATGVATGLLAIGYLLERARGDGFRAIRRPLAFIAGGAVASMLIFGVFLWTRSEVVSAITETAYPGQRTTQGGDYPPEVLFGSHLMPLVQDTTRGTQFFGNQSEVSNFLLLAPFLLIPAVVSIAGYRTRRGRWDAPMILVNAGIVVIILRLLVPGTNGVFRFLLFDRVPSQRLLLGLGLLGFFQIVLLKRSADEGMWKPTARLTAGVGLGTFAVLAASGITITRRFPAFVDNVPLTLALAAAFTAIVLAYLRQRFLVGTLLLIAFSAMSVFAINPLYRGLGPLTGTRLASVMTSIGDEDGAWIVANELFFEQYPLHLGLHSFAGVYAYPQLEVWEPLDPDGSKEETYNRYAHVTYWSAAKDITLQQPDHFVVPMDGCSAFVRQHGIKHVLAGGALESPSCLELERVVRYPERDFHIYRVTGSP